MSDNQVPNYKETLDLVNSYMECCQNDEAIEALMKLINMEIQTADIYLTLGHIYKNKKLDLQAKESYEKAIELAVDELFVLIAAKAALARIEANLGNKEEANRLFQEARDKFKAFGIENQLLDFNNSEAFFSLSAACVECVDPTNGQCGRWVGTGRNRRCQAYGVG